MKIGNTLFLVIALLFLAGCKTSPTQETDTGLPSPPSGFSWHESINGAGSFLKPDGWFVKEESKGSTNAVFISKESIENNGRFLTGMSVNQLNYWSKSKKTKPSKYAEVFATKIATTGKVLKRTVVKGNQDNMYVVRVLGDNKGTPTITHHLAIGMDSKDQVYLISYESPESEWKANYNYAREMLNFFFLGS